MIEIYLISISVIVTFVCIFSVIRSNWVFNRIIEVLNSSDDIGKNLDEYDKLPGYFFMFFHFWVWDIEKFKEMGKK